MKDVNNVQGLVCKKKSQVIPLKMIDRKAVPSQLFCRNAFKMKLKPGFKTEYKRRHDKIWPELSCVLKNAGISDYSIYLDEETNTLFACQKLAPDHTAADLPNNLVVQKWWNYMSDIMDYNDNNTPVSIPLKEMFCLE